jgi:ABC-type multidrug transport system fused ATPase/permease subunit
LRFMRNLYNYPLPQYVRDLARYISPYRRLFFLGFIIRLTSDLSRLYPAWALSRVVLILSDARSLENSAELLTIFITWGLAMLYYGFSHNFSKFLGYQVAEKASLDIFKESLSHLFRLDLAWQEKENSGNKMKRIDKGLDGVNISIRRIFDTLIETCVNLIGIVIIFFTLEKGLSLSLIFFIITYFILGTYLLKKAVNQERIVNKEFEDLGGLTFEALNNIHTIKSLLIDKGIVRMVKRNVVILMKKIKRRILLYQRRNTALLLYESVFGFTIISILTFGITQERYDVGLLVLFIGLYQRVTTSTRELTDVTQQLALAKIWVSRAMFILHTNPVIENPDKIKNQLKFSDDWKKIKVDNIRFSYKRKEILKGVTLTVNRGEKIGIVGQSGAGKSTLFKLMLDLYENYEGQIFIDNIPLKNIERQSYIDHVAVVLQDTELFDMTLKENIEIAAVKKRNTDKELLEEVIRMARLEEVVAELPYGVNTVVGEKGVKLSGGQRQRVGIARALYRQPDILLLDEATSHLDAHSENEIQKALRGFIHKFTTIVIAHRLSTIKAMDKIVVLEQGKVSEQGNFEQLLEKGGAFSAMWQEQKL